MEHNTQVTYHNGEDLVITYTSIVFFQKDGISFTDQDGHAQKVFYSDMYTILSR